VTPRFTVVSGNPDASSSDEARIAAELRALLVPPRGAQDFAALEARIMAAATARPGDPIPVLARWARPAMVAAAAALMVAVATDMILRRQEQRMAVLNMLGVPAAAASESAMRPDVAREATLQQLLEP
jgi:hypothetical protein